MRKTQNSSRETIIISPFMSQQYNKGQTDQSNNSSSIICQIDKFTKQQSTQVKIKKKPQGYKNEDDQAMVDSKDQRNFVQYRLESPYNCIGNIAAYYKVDVKSQKSSNKSTSKQSQDFNKSGMGAIIGHRYVVTSAHVVYCRELGIQADKIVFFFKCDQGIKIQKCLIHPGYLDKNNKQYQSCDVAILILKQNQIIKNNQFLDIKWDYQHYKQKDQKIKIVGYKLNEKFANLLAQQQRIPLQKQINYGFLSYMHTTSGGHSGTPSDKLVNWIIGVHKGTKSNANYGLLLGQCMNFKQILTKMIEGESIQKYLDLSNQPLLFRKMWQQRNQYKSLSQILKSQNDILNQQLKLKNNQLTSIKNQYGDVNTIQGLRNKIIKLQTKNSQYQENMISKDELIQDNLKQIEILKSNLSIQSNQIENLKSSLSIQLEQSEQLKIEHYKKCQQLNKSIEFLKAKYEKPESNYDNIYGLRKMNIKQRSSIYQINSLNENKQYPQGCKDQKYIPNVNNELEIIQSDKGCIQKLVSFINSFGKKRQKTVKKPQVIKPKPSKQTNTTKQLKHYPITPKKQIQTIKNKQQYIKYMIQENHNNQMSVKQLQLQINRIIHKKNNQIYKLKFSRYKFNMRDLTGYRWPYVEKVQLVQCSINDYDWQVLAQNIQNFPKLKILSIWNNQISTVTKSSISKLNYLKQIWFRNGSNQGNRLTQQSKDNLKAFSYKYNNIKICFQ